MSIAEKLRMARGLESRKSVCAAVGVGLSTLAMYETGRRVPKDSVKRKLAAHYRTSVQALFFDDIVALGDI